MGVRLTWSPRVIGDEQRIYRSSQPFTTDNLPAVLETVAGSARHYDDSTALAGVTYWYAVSVVLGGREKVGRVVSTIGGYTEAGGGGGDPYFADVVVLYNFQSLTSNNLAPTGSPLDLTINAGSSLNATDGLVTSGIGQSASTPADVYTNGLDLSGDFVIEHFGLVFGAGVSADVVSQVWNGSNPNRSWLTRADTVDWDTLVYGNGTASPVSIVSHAPAPTNGVEYYWAWARVGTTNYIYLRSGSTGDATVVASNTTAYGPWMGTSQPLILVPTFIGSMKAFRITASSRGITGADFTPNTAPLLTS